MIYKLIVEEIENLKKLYLNARYDMLPQRDSIHVIRKGKLMNNLTKEDLHKNILMLEGQFRTQHNLWNAPSASVKVI